MSAAKIISGCVVLCVPTQDGHWLLSVSQLRGPRIGVSSPGPRAQGEHVSIRKAGSVWELVR